MSVESNACAAAPDALSSQGFAIPMPPTNLTEWLSYARAVEQLGPATRRTAIQALRAVVSGLVACESLDELLRRIESTRLRHPKTARYWRRERAVLLASICPGALELPTAADHAACITWTRARGGVLRDRE